MELLAPAGNPDAAFAAFAYGADAIYCGMRQFSARAVADNFDRDELSELVDFAHRAERPRKVYVTVNTVVLERELPELLRTLDALAELAVDAVIVQDLGTAQLIRTHFPSLELHASTQMGIHNVAGARQLAPLGFRRLIPARELGLDEIQDICAVPNLDVEVFVHGALCYAYSGLCLLSSHLRGSSGNRGQCSYLCRNGLFRTGESAHCAAMSMCDLALPDQLDDLRRAGVASLKIEGRKKSPLYVSVVTDYYRRLLDGTLSPNERLEAEFNLKTVFSRPWTTLFLDSPQQEGLTDTSTVGHRGAPLGQVEGVTAGEPDRLRFTLDRHGIERHDGIQLDVAERERPFGFSAEMLWVNGRPTFEAQRGETIEVGLPDSHPALPRGTPVYCGSSQTVKRTYRWSRPRPGQHRVRQPIAVTVEFTRDALHAEATCGSVTSQSVLVLDESLSPARTPESVANAVEKSFRKLGDTEFSLASLEVRNPDVLFAPASFLNELRRKAMLALAKQLTTDRETRLRGLLSPVSFPASEEAEHWSLMTDQPSVLADFQADAWEGLDEVVLDISRADWPEIEGAIARIPADRLRLALPAVARQRDEAKLKRRIAILREQGHERWQVANLSGLTHLAPHANLDILADWPLYVLNTPAMQSLDGLDLQGWTLSPEDGQRNLADLLPAAPGRSTLVVYQDTPLAISATCLFASANGSCPGKNHCDATTQEWSTRNGDHLLAINDNCRTVVLNARPLSLSGHLRALRAAGGRRFRVDFLWRDYDPATAQGLWQSIRADQRLPNTHPGNLDRELDHS
jgi:U32 family peptidase